MSDNKTIDPQVIADAYNDLTDVRNTFVKQGKNELDSDVARIDRILSFLWDWIENIEYENSTVWHE